MVFNLKTHAVLQKVKAGTNPDGILYDPASKRVWPETGEDVKVMATRAAGVVRLTIGCAFVSAFVEDAADYLAKKARLTEAITQRVATRLGVPVQVDEQIAAGKQIEP